MRKEWWFDGLKMLGFYLTEGKKLFCGWGVYGGGRWREIRTHQHFRGAPKTLGQTSALMNYRSKINVVSLCHLH